MTKDIPGLKLYIHSYRSIFVQTQNTHESYDVTAGEISYLQVGLHIGLHLQIENGLQVKHVRGL
jgi:hypothetical protein